jgi:hypothetical protein
MKKFLIICSVIVLGFFYQANASDLYMDMIIDDVKAIQLDQGYDPQMAVTMDAEHTSKVELIFPRCTDVLTTFKVDPDGNALIQFCVKLYDWPGGNAAIALGLYYKNKLAAYAKDGDLGNVKAGTQELAISLMLQGVPLEYLPIDLTWAIAINEGTTCPPWIAKDTVPDIPGFRLEAK